MDGGGRGEWVIVPNWDRFQHYSDRDPLWIKVYSELNSSDEWRTLTYTQRGVLVSLWIEYGRSRGVLRVTNLGARLGQRVLGRTLDALVLAGFIQLSASKPLALTRSREKILREEKKEPVLARKDQDQEQINAKRAKNWIQNGLADEVPADRLPEVLADEFKLTDNTLILDLVAQAQDLKLQ